MNLISQSKKNIARIFLYLIFTLTLNTTIFKKNLQTKFYSKILQLHP